MTLFGRTVAIRIGNREYSYDSNGGLRLAFEITRTFRGEPDTGTVTLYNLAKADQAAAVVFGVGVQVKAGYQSNADLIFKGKVREGATRSQTVDRVTQLQVADGELELRKAKVSKTLAPGATLGQALKEVLGTLSLDVKKALQDADGATFGDRVSQVFNGVVLAGTSKETLTKLTDAAGLDWTVQNEQVVIKKKGVRSPTVVVLRPDTGLLDSPEVGVSLQDGNLPIVKVSSLLQPKIYPLQKLRVESAEFTGELEVRTVRHTGDTWGQQWYSEIEGRTL